MPTFVEQIRKSSIAKKLTMSDALELFELVLAENERSTAEVGRFNDIAQKMAAEAKDDERLATCVTLMLDAHKRMRSVDELVRADFTEFRAKFKELSDGIMKYREEFETRMNELLK